MKKLLLSLVSVLTGIAVGIGVMGKVSGKESEKVQTMSDKHLALFLLMNQWVKVKQKGKSLSSYFVEHSYNKIAVYGMSYVGETLLEELKDSQVEIRYAIDKNAEGIYSEVEVVPLDSDLEAVDAIVVTAITYFDEISDVLSKKVTCPIISMEEILYEL